jgi:ABC-type phosphate transport system substrate-binding protein
MFVYRCAYFAFLVSSVSAQSAQCGSGGFKVAGSSTVQPVAVSWAQNFGAQCNFPVVTNAATGAANAIIVEGGGSSVGAGRVCGNAARGTPVEIGTMSRDWRESEASTSDFWNYKCKLGDTSRSVIQCDVAIDGITVVVKKGGVADNCIKLLPGKGLTQDQLRWIYSSYTIAQLKLTGWKETALSLGSGKTDNLWNSLHKGCSPSEINISGPDNLSGTYEYFREKILKDFAKGEIYDESGLRKYFNSAVDETIAKYVENDASAIGFFGFAFYVANTATLSSVAIQNRAGDYISPSKETILTNEYFPLSRRIYMNVLKGTLEKTGPFMEYGYSPKGDANVVETGYDPVPAADQILMLSRIQSGRGIALSDITCGDGSGVITVGGIPNLRPHMNIWALHYMDACPKFDVLLVNAVVAQAIPKVCGNTAGKTTVATTNVKFRGTAAGNAYTFQCPKKPKVEIIELQMAPGPLFAYASNIPAEIAASRSFLRFALSNVGTKLLTLIGLTPNPEDVRSTMLGRIPLPIVICFSGQSTVEVENRGVVAMQDLSIGDNVKVSGGKYSRVYSFGHYDRDVQASYVSIDAGLGKPLIVSQDHMVFVNDKPMKASFVSVGDKLSLANGYATVKEISKVTAGGAFAPFTKEGTIIVDSIKVSSYVDLDVNSYLSKGIFSFLNMHWIAHLSQAPHRLVCELNKSFCSSETYNNGISVWVGKPLALSNWLFNQNAVVMMALFIPVISLLMFAGVIEMTIQSPIILAVIAVFALMRKSKKSNP